MSIGIGGSTASEQLSQIVRFSDEISVISQSDFQLRLEKVQNALRNAGYGALYLDATSNLLYFTGLHLKQSERLHGALIPASGDMVYIAPAFEKESTEVALRLEAEIATWQEHENPADLVTSLLHKRGLTDDILAVDPLTTFATIDAIQESAPLLQIISAAPLINACRMIKSAKEIALLQHAKDITLQVQKAAARILRPGMPTAEVKNFLDQAHIAMGADGPSTFKIVLFGKATAYPHGVPYEQHLNDGDMVLIDTGAEIDGYKSDITRSYVFGKASDYQRKVWETEKAAQLAAFAAAKPGRPCSACDDAARDVIEAAGFGPDYAVPGLPHRTGHGTGLDLHEAPYLVRGNKQVFEAGMCVSNEPMICHYGEFGVRLEDHFYMTESGPHWFTEPALSLDDPFGNVPQR